MREASVETLARQAARSLVQVHTSLGEGLGFVVGNQGHVVTGLHLVVGADDIELVLDDGQSIVDIELAGFDGRRDLVVLQLPEGTRPRGLPLDEGDSLVEGSVLVGLDLTAGVSGVALTVEKKLPLAPGLHVAVFTQVLPGEDTGAPLLSAEGRVVGFSTAARRDDAPVTLGMPLTRLTALIEGNTEYTLDLLKALPPRGARQVPRHPLGLLEGHSAAGLERVLEAIAAAIEVGAPAYNEGHVEVCYDTYVRAAVDLIAERDDCPGVQQALRDGLDKAGAVEDIDGQAWAMRDCFDGLVKVIERWFEVQAELAQPKASGKKKYLN
jgi:hypothetical protein